MRNFGTLYRYELEKIIRKKLFWITFFLCTIGIIFSVLSGLLGTYYVDGEAVDTHYNLFLADRDYLHKLSGRTIDQKLLEEMSEAYGHVPSAEGHYTLSDEYQTYARPYSAVFNLVRLWTSMDAASVMNWEPDEQFLYESRRNKLQDRWQYKVLSEQEKDFLREKEEQLNIPFTYSYHEGYRRLLDLLLTVGVFMHLFVAICLSGVFPQEHTRKTDQLILCSVNGRKAVYWAKISAGSSLAAVCTIFFTILTFGLSLGIYGFEGFFAPIQLYFFSFSYLTMGQACLIAYGILIITSLLASIFVMVLSWLLHSSIASLAVSAGFIILGMIVNLPEEYLILSQIWDYLPMSFLAAWNIFDFRLITIGRHCFTSWQIVPLIYVLCSFTVAVNGKRRWVR